MSLLYYFIPLNTYKLNLIYEIFVSLNMSLKLTIYHFLVFPEFVQLNFLFITLSLCTIQLKFAKCMKHFNVHWVGFQ